jgi:hypothetical protein
LQGLVKVGNGPGQVPQAVASDTPVVIGLRLVGIDLQGAVEIGKAAGAITTYEAGGPAETVFSGLGWADHRNDSSDSVVGPGIGILAPVRM